MKKQDWHEELEETRHKVFAELETIDMGQEFVSKFKMWNIVQQYIKTFFQQTIDKKLAQQEKRVRKEVIQIIETELKFNLSAKPECYEEEIDERAYGSALNKIKELILMSK